MSNRYQVGLAEDVNVGQLDLEHRVQRRQAHGDEFGRVAAVVGVDLGANSTNIFPLEAAMHRGSILAYHL